MLKDFTNDQLKQALINNKRLAESGGRTMLDALEIAQTINKELRRRVLKLLEK